MIRKPAVAGQFYSADKADLLKMVSEFIPHNIEPIADAKAIVSPHAGLVYSGSVSGKTYASAGPADTYVLIGPNHRGMGSPLSIMTNGSWEIPTGTLEINDTLASAILSECTDLQDDESAHAYEHSLEVQLPFICQMNQSARIVPIMVTSASTDQLLRTGDGIARAIKSSDEKVIIVASSDMSHFLSDKQAREIDKLAIDRILELNPSGLHRTVREHNITMCGVMPTVIAIEAALKLGATSAKLVMYTTSAEANGDYSRVVGYAGFTIA